MIFNVKEFQQKTKDSSSISHSFSSVQQTLSRQNTSFGFCALPSLVKEARASTTADDHLDNDLIWFDHYIYNDAFQLPRGSSLHHATTFQCVSFQLTGINHAHWPKQGNIQSKLCSRLAWPAPNPVSMPGSSNAYQMALSSGREGKKRELNKRLRQKYWC